MTDIKTVNTMCLNCGKYGHNCDGTDNTVWTGCIYKTKKEESAEERASRMFEHYRRRLAEIGAQHRQLRYNVVEYLCAFPKIDPAKMAAALIMDGYNVVFDDSSIGAKENASKRWTVENEVLKLWDEKEA